MGNIHASSSGLTSTLPPSPIPAAPSSYSSNQEKDSSPPLANLENNGKPPGASNTDAFVSNPGTLEDIHKKCKDVFPVMFEGGKFILNKPVSNHFQVSHSINFSSVQPPGYKFGATYVGTEQIGPSEAYPVMLGEIDPSGNLNANIIHQITSNLRAKFVSQIQGGKWQASQLTADWRGHDYTTSLTLGNIDLLGGSGVAVAHYLQKVSQRLDLGAEVAYQYGMQVPGGHVAVYSMAGKYSSDKFVASGTLGAAGIHLCYYQKASESVQFGVELETSLRMQESTATMAYQVDIPKANFTFKGSLDTNWTVGAVLEKKLMPLPFTFALSAMLNQPKNQFKVGCGFIIG